MKTFHYHVNSYFENAEATLRTNDVHIAIKEFFAYLEDDVHCNIVDGTTGEVLAIANCPDMENYTTDEMALMMLGYLMEETWGEAEESESETCGMCGGDVVDGVCEYCGRSIPQPAHPADPIIPLLSALFGVPTDAIVAMPN